MPDKEVWRVIKTHPKYSVSNRGRIRRNADGHMMSQSKTRDGYWKISLSCGKPGQRDTLRVSRLVAKAFIGPEPSRFHVVHHKSNDKEDNRVQNLEWISQKQNVLESVRHRGGVRPGVTNHDLRQEILAIKDMLEDLLGRNTNGSSKKNTQHGKQGDRRQA